MVWVPKARIAFANDPIMAAELRRDDSESGIALRDVVGGLVPEGVAEALADPSVSGIVSSAVDQRLSNLDVLQSTTVATDAFELAVGDKDGRPTWLRADKAGASTPGVIEALAAKGLARAISAQGDEFEIAIGDEEGRPTWMRANSLGWPSAVAAEIIRAIAGVRIGPMEPNVYPGLPAVWIETDGFGNLIDIKGVGL